MMSVHAAGIIFICLVLFLDQVTKAFIVIFKPFHLPVTSFFNLVYVLNPGMSFGLFQSIPPFYRIFLWVAIFLLLLWVFVSFLKAVQPLEVIALSFILSGGLGNMLDRYFYGAVIDFLDFYWYAYHWPAFNIADASIVVGVFLYFLSGLCVLKK